MTSEHTSKRIGASIWLIERFDEPVTRKMLRHFVFRNLAARKIVVFKNEKLAMKHRRALKWFLRFRLIERYIDVQKPEFYDDVDLALSRLSKETAAENALGLTENLLRASSLGLDPSAIKDISAGLEVRMEDAIYIRFRKVLSVCELVDLPANTAWEDYSGWCLTKSASSLAGASYPTRGTGYRASDENPGTRKITLTGRTLHRQNTSGKPTVLLFSTFAQTYQAAAAGITITEATRGARPEVIFPANPFEAKATPAFLKQLGSVVSFPTARLGSKTLEKQEPEATIHTTRAQLQDLLKDIEIKSPMSSCNDEMATHLVRDAIISAIEQSFMDIVSFYRSITEEPDFLDVKTCIFAPSRSPFFVPALNLFKRRGATLIEYQAFFWSAHPRYEVRDMDVFVCSDGATKDVIERKYANTEFSPKILLGPSFLLSEFRTKYDSVVRMLPAKKPTDLIGIALQPTGLEQFRDACVKLKGLGHDLVIRKHPSQRNADVASMFGSFGATDDGSLEDFLFHSKIVVTGFSNVAVQASSVGKPVVCLPIPESLGLDLNKAAANIMVCQTMEDLPRLLQKAMSETQVIPPVDAKNEWLWLREQIESDYWTKQPTD